MESNNDDLELIKGERAAVGEKHQSNKASDGRPVNDRVYKPSDQPAVDEEHVLSRERLQMPCAVDNFPERPNSSNETIIETTEISPHDNADDNTDDDCASAAHISRDDSNKSTLGAIQADVAQEPSGEAEQEALESSEEMRSRKKRRRRRHRVKNHHGSSRKDHGTLRSKRSGSSGNGTSQGGRRRQGHGHGSNKPSQRNHCIKSIRSRHGILQGLLRVFYTTKRLFCA